MLLTYINEIFIILTFVDEYRAIPLCDDGIEAFGGCTQSVVDAVFFFQEPPKLETLCPLELFLLERCELQNWEIKITITTPHLLEPLISLPPLPFSHSFYY